MPSAQSSFRNENFVCTSENLLKNRNGTFPVVHGLTWKLEFLSNILWIIVRSFTWKPDFVTNIVWIIVRGFTWKLDFVPNILWMIVVSYLNKINVQYLGLTNTAQKINFPIKDFSSKCDQTGSFLRIWSHLL